jgi:hypothetical protein
MADLIQSSEIKIFYVWVNPNDFMANNNSKANLSFFSVPRGNDNLMFIPNPNFKGGFISPFQMNLLGNYGRDPLIGLNFMIWKSQEFLQAPNMID